MKWLKIRMEEGKNNCDNVNVGNVGGKSKENGISGGEGRPPNPLAAVYRQCLSSGNPLGDASCKKSLVRHPSLVKKRTGEKILKFSFLNCFSPCLKI